MFEAPQGKPCPGCGEPLSDLSTLMRRLCTNGKCGASWLWTLKDEQQPLISSSRDRRTP